MKEIRNTYKVFLGNPEEKLPVERPMRGWEDNIKMDRMEIRWEGDWLRIGTSGRLV
jgi:hypothetical protein